MREKVGLPLAASASSPPAPVAVGPDTSTRDAEQKKTVEAGTEAEAGVLDAGAESVQDTRRSRTSTIAAPVATRTEVSRARQEAKAEAGQTVRVVAPLLETKTCPEPLPLSLPLS